MRERNITKDMTPMFLGEYEIVPEKEKEIREMILNSNIPLDDYIEYQKAYIEVAEGLEKLLELGLIVQKGGFPITKELQALHRGLNWLKRLKK